MNNPNRHGPVEKMGRKKTGSIMLRLGKYVFAHWPLFITALLLTLLSNQLSLLGPRYSGEAIDAITAEGGVRFDVVQTMVVRMLVCYVLAALLSYVLRILMLHLSQKIVYAMRRQQIGRAHV